VTDGKKRLFIAVGIPAEIIARLSEVQEKLKKFAPEAGWVKPDNVHLTLKFLGYVDERKLLEIMNELSRDMSAYKRPSIEMKGCGFFPNGRRPSVFWAGVTSESLQELQGEVEKRMTLLGFEPEKREYHPHLTLARLKDTNVKEPLVEAAAKYKDFEFGQYTPDHFSVYESILHPKGANYHIVRSFQFQ